MESLFIKVPKKDGEKTRQTLLGQGVIDKGLKIRSDGRDVLIPVIKIIEGAGDLGRGDFETLEKKVLPDIEAAYELIGDIAIIDQHEIDAQQTANALLKHKNIKTVLQAQSAVAGEYRTRQLSFITGENRTETTYRENECRYLLDVAQVYFTPRLSSERMRIADQIRDGDKIVDMFAGVGPFSILIAKKNTSSEVIAIDKNPVAIKYLRENVRINKVKNVIVREGDARDEAKGIKDADHIIMNLPHSSLEFLDAALSMIRKGGIIHLYAIAHENDLFDGILKSIEEIASRYDLRVSHLDRRIVRPYAPYQFNICIDFLVE